MNNINIMNTVDIEDKNKEIENEEVPVLPGRKTVKKGKQELDE